MNSIYNYLIDVSFKPNEFVEDPLILQNYLIHIVDELGFNVIGKLSHKFEPMGVTSLVMLSESHISIHTWPEYGFGSIDILTCSGRLNKKKVIELITDLRLGINVEQCAEIKRELSYKIAMMGNVTNQK